MSEENGVLDMDLSSGIAAFEAKHFGTATSLLGPLGSRSRPLL